VSLVWSGLAALGVAAAATWIVARVAGRIRLVDHPGPYKVHRTPVPLAGGVGVAAGVTVGVLWGWPSPTVLVSLWALVAVGLADDVRDLRARTRLTLQAMAVLPALLEWTPSVGVPRPAEIGMALLWTVAAISAVKCIDCADAITAPVAIVGAVALGGLAGWQGPSASLAAALTGAAAGFLVWNIPPARCFLGESGSTALGFLLVLVGLQAAGTVPADRTWAAALAGPAVLVLPVLDFALVHARRVRAGVRRLSDLMASRGTDHLPHRLAARGLGPAKVALACSGATAIGGAVAQLLARAGTGGAVMGVLALTVAFFASEVALSRLRLPREVRRAHAPGWSLSKFAPRGTGARR
jgi:UDP-GlcNAc:undecaprenyl-phosphate GlcNAc-1-phosphate transferase